jgi:hypothetical protein
VLEIGKLDFFQVEMAERKCQLLTYPLLTYPDQLHLLNAIFLRRAAFDSCKSNGLAYA